MSEKSTGTVTAAPRRKRHWLRRIAVAALVLVVGLVAARQIMVWRAERELAGVKAVLSFKLVAAKDLPTLWGAAPKAEDNAAPLYVESQKKLDPLLHDSEGTATEVAAAKEQKDELYRLQIIWGIYPPDADLFPEEKLKKDEDNVDRPVKIPPRDLARAHKFFDQFADVFRLWDKAARKPGYRRDVDWSDLGLKFNYLLNRMDLTNLAVLRAEVAADEGRWDEAYGLMLTVAATARQLDQEPFLINELIANTLRGMAIQEMSRLMARHPPSSATAEALRASFATDPRERLRLCLITEASLLDSLLADIERSAAQWVQAERCEKPTDRDIELPEWPVCWMLLEHRALSLRGIDDCTQMLNQPTMKVLADLGTLKGPNSVESTGRKVLFKIPLAKSKVLAPWNCSVRKSWSSAVIVEAAESHFRDQAMSRMMSVALEVATYRQEHGKYPAALAELANADKLPRDPFTETGGAEDGRQFCYRLLDDGFALWSVGKKGKATATKPLDELLELSCGCFLRVPPKASWERTDEKQGENGAKP
jgi:hypothetical protein